MTLALGVSLFGCGPAVDLPGADSSSSSAEPSDGQLDDSVDSTVGTSSSPSTTGATSSVGESTSLDTADTTGADDEWDDSSCGFYGGCPTDAGVIDIECDVWAQDCPVGEKCMPWANDGGNSWNATRCSPVANDAAGVGESCIVEGTPVSGFDTCELGAVCWNVDPETLQGTCVGQCTGQPAMPLCPEPLVCSVTNEGVLTLCLTPCDPLGDDCSDDETCVALNDGFVCVPDGQQAGAHGDACSDADGCEAGTLCIDGVDVPGCATETCCSSLCELDDPDPCPDVEQVCADVFDRQPGVGLCVIPR